MIVPDVLTPPVVISLVVREEAPVLILDPTATLHCPVITPALAVAPVVNVVDCSVPLEKSILLAEVSVQLPVRLPVVVFAPVVNVLDLMVPKLKSISLVF